jgi:hypothetical protein
MLLLKSWMREVVSSSIKGDGTVFSLAITTPLVALMPRDILPWKII